MIFNPSNRIEIFDELNDFKTEPNENRSKKDRIPEDRDETSEDQENLNVDQDDKLVQLKPDKIKLDIRPNTKIRFNITFAQAEKYPLDIYYLMDLTYSMKDHRKNNVLGSNF